MSDIPECQNCGVEHLWILSLNDMVTVVNFTCNECGWQQTRVIAEKQRQTPESAVE